MQVELSEDEDLRKQFEAEMGEQDSDDPGEASAPLNLRDCFPQARTVRTSYPSVPICVTCQCVA